MGGSSVVDWDWMCVLPLPAAGSNGVPVGSRGPFGVREGARFRRAGV